jgi:hypothetical protein
MKKKWFFFDRTFAWDFFCFFFLKCCFLLFFAKSRERKRRNINKKIRQIYYFFFVFFCKKYCGKTAVFSGFFIFFIFFESYWKKVLSNPTVNLIGLFAEKSDSLPHLLKKHSHPHLAKGRHICSTFFCRGAPNSWVFWLFFQKKKKVQKCANFLNVNRVFSKNWSLFLLEIQRYLQWVLIRPFLIVFRSGWLSKHLHCGIDFELGRFQKNER